MSVSIVFMRGQLLEVYEALPKTSVSTSGFILEVAKLGMADLGDAATSESFDRLRPSRDLGGLKDALLAATASGKADILVTEDTDLQKKAAGESVPAWSFEQFHRFVRETAL